MSNLIIRRGMTKLAAAEDGPTFEQQFGILANAQIANQYPKLDQMRLAFQLIEKKDDNSAAVGAAVYLVGDTVIFIPAFYKNGKIDTGDMMFLAETQQFLPLSDPWLAWVQNKNLPSAGTIAPEDALSTSQLSNAITIREITDPILKTASVYLRGLLRTTRDIRSITSGQSIFDTALTMGKKASETLLDNLITDNAFLNAALHFYSGDELDAFAKKASELDNEVETVKVVLPFTKEAAELTPEETEILQRDGYIVKKAAGDDNVPKTVLRRSRLKDSFKKVSTPGMKQLLTMDGQVKECLVLRDRSLGFEPHDGDKDQGIELYGDRIGLPKGTLSGEPGWNPGEVMGTNAKLCALVTKNAKRPEKLPLDVMGMSRDTDDDFKPGDIADYGVKVSPDNVDRLDYNTSILCPDGCAYTLRFTAIAKGNAWYCPYEDDCAVVVGTEDSQLSPIVTDNYIILPNKARCVRYERNEGLVTSDQADKNEEKSVNASHPLPFVSWSNFEHFLTNYANKHYDKVNITMHGNDVRVTSDKTAPDEEVKALSVKEATLKLVNEFGLEPGIARDMLHDCMGKTASGRIDTESYLITKTAAAGMEETPPPNIGAHTQENIGPVHDYVQMPSVLESPEQLQKAVTIAAENGIKDVFDVTTFKLLVRQNRFVDEIQEDIPMFMRALDSLCRKLFLLYWHTEDFERQYGTVKLKSLEESLKNTLDSLSDLTIFFKMRTASTDVTIGQDGGDLMRGYDL